MSSAFFPLPVTDPDGPPGVHELWTLPARVPAGPSVVVETDDGEEGRDCPGQVSPVRGWGTERLGFSRTRVEGTVALGWRPGRHVGVRPSWASSGAVLLTGPDSKMGIGGTPTPAPAMLAFRHGHWSPLWRRDFLGKPAVFRASSLRILKQNFQ